jgi:ABC-type sugar transport system substrate-binding protein
MTRLYRGFGALALAGLLAAGCARALDPQILVGASETRAVVLSAPDRGWRDAAQAHCAQYGREAQLRSVQKPDPAPQTVKSYLGAREMGPNSLYYFDCVDV